MAVGSVLTRRRAGIKHSSNRLSNKNEDWTCHRIGIHWRIETDMEKLIL
jgi:hypothetical protein